MRYSMVRLVDESPSQATAPIVTSPIYHALGQVAVLFSQVTSAIVQTVFSHPEHGTVATSRGQPHFTAMAVPTRRPTTLKKVKCQILFIEQWYSHYVLALLVIFFCFIYSVAVSKPQNCCIYKRTVFIYRVVICQAYDLFILTVL